jgi:hypothetical protein
VVKTAILTQAQCRDRIKECVAATVSRYRSRARVTPRYHLIQYVFSLCCTRRIPRTRQGGAQDSPVQHSHCKMDSSLPDLNRLTLGEEIMLSFSTDCNKDVSAGTNRYGHFVCRGSRHSNELANTVSLDSLEIFTSVSGVGIGACQVSKRSCSTRSRVSAGRLGRLVSFHMYRI